MVSTPEASLPHLKPIRECLQGDLATSPDSQNPSQVIPKDAVTLVPEYGRGYPVNRRLTVSREVIPRGAGMMPANGPASGHRGLQSFLVQVT
jgi:hypothetical protein